MKIDNKDLLNSILQNLSSLKMPHSDDLPNIDLYMDQVTTYMERYLSVSKRYDEDKILTKTMINNYAKNNKFDFNFSFLLHNVVFLLKFDL